MCLPYSAARRERLRISTLTPSTPQISAAISSSRQLFDISPGQVCSERDEPLMIRMQGGCDGSSCSARAWSIAALAAIQSTGEVVIRIGEAGTGLLGARRLAAVDIAVPGDVGDAIQLGLRARRRPGRRYCARKRRLNSASSSSTGGMPLRGAGARPTRPICRSCSSARRGRRRGRRVDLDVGQLDLRARRH